ncbi:MAG: peptidyl-tRNA hydrolase, partial [Methanosarcinales archaeon]
MFGKPEKEYKQCIVLRADLKLSKGKAAAQAAHAS